jgi:hypothetical protein
MMLATTLVLDLAPRSGAGSAMAKGNALVSVRWAASQGDGN